MELNPVTDPARPDPATAAVAANPKPLAVGLLLVGLLGLVAGVYFGYTAYAQGKPPADAPEGEALGRLVSPGYIAAAVTGLLVALAGLGIGAATVARVPADDPRRRLSDARTTILTAGGVLGLIVLVAGCFYLYLSFDVLTTWLNDKAPPKDAWKPVASLLAVLAGAGCAFLAAQPARAEERNNPFLRRLVYGGNLALGTLLLLLALVVGNVLVGLKVPNKLDTTEAGFYSLSDKTKEYVTDLSQPVTFYTTIPEGEIREFSDVRRLLTAMQELNPRNVKVTFLSPTFNTKDIAALKNKFPLADLTEYGVVVATGPDDSNYSFLRAQDFFQSGPGGGTSFQAEGKLVKELVFLSESKTKPVVYALAGHGELELVPDPAGEGGGRRQAGRVRAALEKVNVDVRPLTFPLKDPKVPEDAAAVLVLDPVSPISPAEAAALKEYMTKPRGDKKGKLVVATGPRPNPDRTGVAPTGLEDLLAGFGVKLGTEYLLTQPVFQGQGYTEVVAAPAPKLLRANNPIAAEFAERDLLLPNCRTLSVTPPPPGGPPGPTADPLFAGVAGPISWFEADPPANPGKLFTDMMTDQDTINRKRASKASRVVAVVASEGESGRLAVFGSGEAFADPDRRAARTGSAPADLMAITVNWLRDRPAVANIAAKDYRTYTLDRKAADSVALVWLPVGATLFGVLALGLGVWVFRRK